MHPRDFSKSRGHKLAEKHLRHLLQETTVTCRLLLRWSPSTAAGGVSVCMALSLHGRAALSPSTSQRPRGARQKIFASRPICPSHYQRSAPSSCQAPVDSSWINKWQTGQSGHGGQEERLLREAALSPLRMEVGTTMNGVIKPTTLGFYPRPPLYSLPPSLLSDAEKTLSS